MCGFLATSPSALAELGHLSYSKTSQTKNIKTSRRAASAILDGINPL
jgi:hypothetical protein